MTHVLGIIWYGPLERKEIQVQAFGFSWKRSPGFFKVPDVKH